MDIKKLFERFAQITAEKKEKVIILFLLGVFFLLAATPVSSYTKKKTSVSEKSTEVQTGKSVQKDAYIEEMENKLEQIIGRMEGAGNVDVMITLKDNGEKILDKNQPYESQDEKIKEEGKESDSTHYKTDQQTVLVEEDGNTVPIIVQELYPAIEGVVVVCDGGEDAGLVVRIKEAVQVLFSVDAHKIVVCKSRKP